MMSEQRAQKFHTDDVRYPDLGSASDWLKEIPTNQKHYQELGSDMSSVWNSCARYSDIVLRGLKWRPRETSAVFSG